MNINNILNILNKENLGIRECKCIIDNFNYMIVTRDGMSNNIHSMNMEDLRLSQWIKVKHLSMQYGRDESTEEMSLVILENRELLKDMLNKYGKEKNYLCM